MTSYSVELKKSFWGHRYKYVYLIYCLSDESFIYVGQTGRISGVLGRLAQHLQQGGTLVKQLEKKGIDLYSQHIKLEYFLLEGNVFNSESYRESLEVLVQNFIPEISPIRIISNIKQNSRSYIKHHKVKSLFENQIQNRLRDIFQVKTKRPIKTENKIKP